jgi:carboxylesterase type B
VITSGSVYTPGSEVVATLGGGFPVVVFIHGGGYIEGAASNFDGADLIVDSNHGVISVLIQYRLGLFGMFYCSFQSQIRTKVYALPIRFSSWGSGQGRGCSQCWATYVITMVR